MRFLAATLLLCGLGVLVGTSAGAAPPSPKFWSAGRCERVLLGIAADGFSFPNGSGHHFQIGQVICVGSGGPHACRWTTGHRSRLYSEFRVFTLSPHNRGLVRSWTLATRTGDGLVPFTPTRGGPADFYMSRTKLLATDATPARFRSMVASIAARLRQQENASGCTGV